MKDMLKNSVFSTTANYVHEGAGAPVIMIHGLAASLHDWDELIPELTVGGYASYALDLLGHGDSPKPDERVYRMDWVFEHFLHWMESLQLHQPAVLIGHSLGGHVALEYARRFPPLTRGLVLVSPFYSQSQLPLLLRTVYRRADLSGLVARWAPEWLVRFLIDAASIATGHSVGGMQSLSARARAQTAADYKRTASGIYHIPNFVSDLTPYLPEIDVPALVVWGEGDRTLMPASYSRLVAALPKARAEILCAGHVPHQSNAAAFNQIAMRFLGELP